MKRSFIIILFFAATFSGAYAQHARFTTDGTIEFEKTVNMYAQIGRMIANNPQQWQTLAFDQYKKTQPQFKTLKSTLAFSKDKTLFTPVPHEEGPRGFFSDLAVASQPNTIYTDISTAKSVSQKSVFESTFLVSDSTRAINWKITSETRDIAGYSCRRANAIVMDSIYVVAFYTDEIPVSGGPESFTGLPGMILGVALPHENVTWFAKIVHDQRLAPGTINAPKKGKAVNNKSLITTVKEAMKDWGEYAQAQMKALLL